MSVDTVRSALKVYGRDGDILEFQVSSATVALAAEALHTEEARIAKTLTFYGADNHCIMIVAAGDTKVRSSAFKARFGFKPRMLSPDDVLAFTGHAIGGVCPFALPEGKVDVYLDESLKRFTTVFPAAGSSNSAIELTCADLENLSASLGWISVCEIRES